MAEGGLPLDRHFGYYRERARGGAAMIVVEPTPPHPTAVLTRGNFLADDAVIPHFRKITDECHSHGTVMCHQIYQSALTAIRTTPGRLTGPPPVRSATTTPGAATP